MKITIVDYGMGNLRSVQKAFEVQGFHAKITSDPKRVESAEKLVMPGVGAFGMAMRNLRKAGLVNPVKRQIAKGTPYLGICLGLQLLMEESNEFGPQKGLGVLKGCVRHLNTLKGFDAKLKTPHMGWNTVKTRKESPVMKGIEDGSYFYFVHSFVVVPDNKEDAATATGYGAEFVSSVSAGNLFACQFHPEKSQDLGLKLLANFARL
jgi:glutamine amidotransferase